MEKLDYLLDILLNEGHQDLYRAVLDKKQDYLPHNGKVELEACGVKATCQYENSKPDIKNALVNVTSSGWGNEDETTLPGCVLSASERR